MYMYMYMCVCGDWRCCVCVCVIPQILSDEEEMLYRQCHSSASSSCSEADTTSSSTNPAPDSERPDKMTKKGYHKERGEKTEQSVASKSLPASQYDHLPIVYAPHSSRVPQGAPVQQYKCKYPGCTQVRSAYN